jgi:endoglucanase
VISNPWKLVYSPHVYGPNVYGQSYFSSGSFPSNMAAIWQAHWGYIPASTGTAVVLGEWGGPYSGKDAQWMDALVSYLKANDMTDQFFWCLNPDSGDTGGLLADDWSTPVSAKLTLLQGLVSSPTTFTTNSAGQVCVSGTSSATTATPSASPKVSSTPSSSPKVSPSSSPKVSASPSPKVSASSTPKVSASSSPKVSASSTPNVAASSTPKVSASSTPKVSASPSPKVSASSTPAASPSASPAADPASPGTDTFTFYIGTSAWWMAVTIPGSTSVQLDCGNGQGYVTMLPAWLPHMWTFTSTNGHPCKSTLQFVVNGGAAQSVTGPF